MNHIGAEVQSCGSVRAMLWTLACIALTCGSGSRGSAFDLRERLHQSFEQWDSRWDKQAVQEFVEAIVELADRRAAGLSNVQIEDISNGLQNLNGARSVTEMTHPIEREVMKQRMLHRIDTYLVLGPGIPEQQQALKEQLRPFFDRCQVDLITKYPQLEDVVTNAVHRVSETMNATIDNDLRRDFKQPVEDQVIDEMLSSWMKVLSRLPEQFDISVGPEMAETIVTAELRGSMHTALVVVGNHSMIETRPKPEKLVRAEEAWRSSYPQIREWRTAKIEGEFHRRAEEIRLRDLRETMGVDDTSLLDHIVKELYEDMNPQLQISPKVTQSSINGIREPGKAGVVDLSTEPQLQIGPKVAQSSTNGIREPGKAGVVDLSTEPKLLSAESSSDTSVGSMLSVVSVLGIAAMALAVVAVSAFRLKSSQARTDPA